MTAVLQATVTQDFPAAQRGDRSAFERLVQSTQRMVASVAMAITGDLQVSEDIAQETFLRAWQTLTGMKSAESFLPWLRQVARNRAIDHVRRARYMELRLDADDPRMQFAAAVGPRPEDSAEHDENRTLLRRALDDVPDDSREVLLLFYREGQSSARVAHLLGLSDAAVRKRLQRAREHLQAGMSAAVADAARHSAPGAAFTASVISALSLGPGVAKAGSAALLGASSKGLHGALGSVFAAVGLVLVAVIWEVRGYLGRARNAVEHRALLRHGVVYAALMVSYVPILACAKRFDWSDRTTLLVAFAYSLAIVWSGILRARILRQHDS